jgi:hypothetical protein
VRTICCEVSRPLETCIGLLYSHLESQPCPILLFDLACKSSFETTNLSDVVVILFWRCIEMSRTDWITGIRGVQATNDEFV